MPSRHRFVAALTAIPLLLGARIAHADCWPENPFSSADAAPRVAVVRAAAGGKGQFSARLQVEKVIKGPATPTSVDVTFHPMSDASLLPGQRYIVFFTPSGGVRSDGCTTIALAASDAQGMPEALAEWAAATDARSRTAFLVRTGTRAPAARGSRAPIGALDKLARSPTLLAAVTVDERAALVRAVPTVADERTYGLAWTLARLHATESVPAWAAFLGVAHSSANPRPVEDALELMTNHHEPAYTLGRDIDGEPSKALGVAWQAWGAKHGAKPAQAAVDLGSRERSARPVPLTDRAALALVVRDEKDELARKVALAACEQLLRTPTSLLGDHANSYRVDWAAAAKVCPAPPKP